MFCNQYIFLYLHKMSDEEYGGDDKNDDDISYDDNNNYDNEFEE